ncbi:MAG: DUF3108 domain-containing protein [Xanthomonadaceae bacterium]|nr:DUF3108 domain-containing protein [Xanthomonadaceae bacterium]
MSRLAPSLYARPLAALVLVAGTLAGTYAMPARALEPFTADYEANYMGLSATGHMSIEPQGGNQWKYTLKIANKVAQLTQTTVFEDRNGDLRPLTGTDASLLLIKKIRRNAVYDWAAGEARWTGDVKPERAGPVALQAGDVDGLLLNLAIARDANAGKPLRYRLVDEGRAKPMNFTVAGKDTVNVGGKPRPATRLVASSGNKQMLIWVVEGLALPARILQRKDGKDDIDLRITNVR